MYKKRNVWFHFFNISILEVCLNAQVKPNRHKMDSAESEDQIQT